MKKNTGWAPLPESELPLKLPKVEQYQPTDTGESPLAAMEKWVKTKCPNCGGAARRETDTMPNWAGSSWYFLAYALGGEKDWQNRIFGIKNC
jgi:leucyl-tRNA synthetase